jgi:hypothetical protein
MEVVAHQAISMDLPKRLLAGLSQRLQKTLLILVVFENGLPTVAAIHYVIYSSGILESELTRHRGIVCQSLMPASTRNIPIPLTDPFSRCSGTRHGSLNSNKLIGF